MDLSKYHLPRYCFWASTGLDRVGQCKQSVSRANTIVENWLYLMIQLSSLCWDMVYKDVPPVTPRNKAHNWWKECVPIQSILSWFVWHPVWIECQCKSNSPLRTMSHWFDLKYFPSPSHLLTFILRTIKISPLKMQLPHLDQKIHPLKLSNPGNYGVDGDAMQGNAQVLHQRWISGLWWNWGELIE